MTGKASNGKPSSIYTDPTDRAVSANICGKLRDVCPKPDPITMPDQIDHESEVNLGHDVETMETESTDNIKNQ